MKFYKYTQDQLIESVKESTSLAQVLKRLGVAPYGGNYDVVRKYISTLELDTSHFTGQAWSKGKTIGPKRPIEDYLSNKISINSHKLRLKLIKHGFMEHKCSCCSLETWLDQPIPLELHHIDGNNKNNDLGNLQVLCPNCHALTSNYRGKNIKT